MQDIKRFHDQFYAHSDKRYQDDFIIKSCKTVIPVRKRLVNGRGNAKHMSIVYKIRDSKGVMIPVCRNFFLNALSIKKGRVRGVLMRHQDTGLMAVERRGGDRKSMKNVGLKDAIISFIKKFKGVESHYCRSKSRRTYLPSELSIASMFKMFIEENAQFPHCKESYFRRIFNTKFNISFSHPRSDMCSTCIELKEKIKIEKDDSTKAQIQVELTIHEKRSKSFFTFLADNDPTVKILSFDCGKNQPLPKVPDQSTYYSRQLYIYNYTIVVGHSHAELTKENVFSYVWTEDVHAKGSNELSSALYHCLQNNVNFTGVEVLRLMADGCSGQNKNSTTIGMVSKWFSSSAPRSLKKVELIFPVTGHSFIPPDRVFGVAEKEIRKRNTIVQPNEYVDIIKKHATVFHLKDIEVCDWKTASQQIHKGTQAFHFKIMSCKRFVFTRMKGDPRGVIVRGEPFYHNDTGSRRSITKPGKYASDIFPEPITTSPKLKKEKINDVDKLLTKHFGKDWMQREDLDYYKTVIDCHRNNANINDMDDDEEVMCEEHVEEPCVGDMI